MRKVTFVILSFEGPDPYSHAGGLGSRVTGLSKALADAGFETHLFFIGDSNLPGHQAIEGRKLTLHRWCQWISQYHPFGVYSGEEDKLADWNNSLPPWLESELLGPKVSAGEQVVVMAEEWHTAGTILALRSILNRRGWGDRVHLLWNANNTFSFHRIDWQGLKLSAVITTVSRYMKHIMARYGVDARVVPNGIPDSWLERVDHNGVLLLSRLLEGRLALVKVARWDPDKRWTVAVDAVAELDRIGMKPVFLARGGLEAYGREVLDRAVQRGLRLGFVHWKGSDVESMTDAIRKELDAQMIVLETYLSEAQRRALFHMADAVLANSGSEPFGLVGLETMATGGIAFVGSTGEDYAMHGYDSIWLQTGDPHEIVHHLAYFARCKADAKRLRTCARHSAARYTWRWVIRRNLLPILEEVGLHFALPVSRFVDEEVFSQLSLWPLLDTVASGKTHVVER